MNKNEKLVHYYARCDIDLDNMILIDVREADEFASGTIPAKMFLPYQEEKKSN